VIEQVVLEQCLSEQTMPIDEQIPSFLLLESGHFCYDIASNDGRVVPCGVFQCRREDILGHGIDSLCPRVIPSRPDPGKVLVGGPAHQHRLARQQLAQSVAQIRLVAILKKARSSCSRENTIN
jgi:hypothetical protein